MEVAGINVQIGAGSKDQIPGIKLFQNIPNPFDQSTLIGFETSEGGKAQLTLFSAEGRVFLVMNIEANKGYNSVRIYQDDLPSGGTYFYQLNCNDFVDIKKLVLLN
jgi:hypothetical protein